MTDIVVLWPGVRCPIASTVRSVCVGVTLCALGSGGARAQVIAEFGAGVTDFAGPLGIAAGPDGNLWFTENQGGNPIGGNDGQNRIGRITPAGVITEFAAGITARSYPNGIAAGPDGNLWFTEPGSNQIGRITPLGVVTEFPGISPGSYPVGIVAGPDGNLWFTEYGASQIGRITRLGAVTEFSLGISPGAAPEHIAAGIDGNLWFTEYGVNRIGRITPAGVITEFSAGTSDRSTRPAGPVGIAAGPDGNVWFTVVSIQCFFPCPPRHPPRIGRITPAGVVTEFSAGFSEFGGDPSGIAAGPDGNLWFTETDQSRIGRITPLGVITEFNTGITAGAGPAEITAGSDGNLWFTEYYGNRIGRLTPETLSIFVPSAAHAPGANGAFYRTDLSVSNIGPVDASFTLKFLEHDRDGTSGPERAFTLGAGQTKTFSDVLGRVFSVTSGYGAIRISSVFRGLIALAQTSTAGFGGTLGQSVPAADASSYLSNAHPGAIGAVREDAVSRTNLVLCNATAAALDVDVVLTGADGSTRGAKRYSLLPLGMTQVTRVVRDLGVAADTDSARLDLSTPAASGDFAAYASVIDNVTNDPRTLLPVRTPASSSAGFDGYLPSAARSAGANGAFYTTDLTISNTSATDASFTLKFFDHDRAGTSGPKQDFSLAAGKSVTYVDVLGSVFGLSSAWGALAVHSASSGGLMVLGQTSTPGFGGAFGQSVPAVSLVSSGAPSSILGVHEDSYFRTNLILQNTRGTSAQIVVTLVANDGTTLGSKSYFLLAFEMTQVSRIVRDLGVSGDLADARLDLAPVGASGPAAFAAYASVIDNVTNDPRTLLTLTVPVSP